MKLSSAASTTTRRKSANAAATATPLKEVRVGGATEMELIETTLTALEFVTMLDA
jgi:hypothetical protein